MCIATLNVSTQQCSHRWYELSRACHPANNLANCPDKLKLEGWETRQQTCPWCDTHEPWVHVHESTHRLFGSTASSSSSSTSQDSPDLGISRTWSWRSNNTAVSAANDGTMSPISRQSSGSSVESDVGQRHRDMNARIEMYLTYDPHEILPSAAKNYPTFAASTTKTEPTSSSAPVRRQSALSNRWRSVRNSVHKLSL